MAESKIKTLFSLQSVKAWVAAATVVVTQVASYTVPDSPPGKLIVSVLGVLVALGAVFGATNGTKDSAVDNRDF